MGVLINPFFVDNVNVENTATVRLTPPYGLPKGQYIAIINCSEVNGDQYIWINIMADGRAIADFRANANTVIPFVLLETKEVYVELTNYTGSTISFTPHHSDKVTYVKLK